MSNQKLFTLPKNGIATLSLKPAEPRIYTSYFGNAAKLKKAGIQMICIARFLPRFTKKDDNLKLFQRLAPTPDMLKGIKGGTMLIEEFNDQYEDILTGLNAQEVYDELLAMGEGKSVAILCYEKPPDTCHRHRVKRWFRDAGLEVKEFPF